VRVIEPMTLDFPALADGVRRNNVGVAGITVQVIARIERAADGAGDALVVVLEPGGQRLPLSGPLFGPAPAEADALRRTFRVQGWDAPDVVTLQLVGDGHLR
jgi:hypothetical protein